MTGTGRSRRKVNPMLLLGDEPAPKPVTEKTVPKTQPVVSPETKTTETTQGDIVGTETFKPRKTTNPLLNPGNRNRPLPNIKPTPPVPVENTPAPTTETSETSTPVETPKKRKQTIAESLGETPAAENPLTTPKPLKTTPPPLIPEPAKPKLTTTPPETTRKVNPMFDLSGDTGRPAANVPNTTPQPGRTLRINPIVNLGVDETPQTLPKRDTTGLFKEKENPKPRSRHTKKMIPQVDIEEWTDDKTTDTAKGLGGENDSAAPKTQYGKGIHMTDRDIIIIRFLARYRYAYTDQLARLVDTTPRTIMARLRKLEQRGFIRREKITDKQYLWVSRKAGNTLVDINFTEAKKGTLSYITLPHTIGLVNLGCEFERTAGGKDLLGEGKGQDNWVIPKERSKFGIWGYEDNQHNGYMTITEREIRQAQLRNRGGRDTKEMRELVHLAFNQPEPIELEEGQEHLFVVYGAGGTGGEHIPDMVVIRPRDENGKTQHIAIELELTPKQPAEWKRILRNFRDNAPQYDKIIYFTHKRVIMNGLQTADKEVGLGDRLIIRKYIPTKNSNLPFWG